MNKNTASKGVVGVFPSTGIKHDCKQIGFVPRDNGVVETGNYKPPVAGPSFWETDIKVVTHCGVLDKNVTITLGPIARSKMNLLMEKFPRMEWLAYLMGDKDNLFISDIVIPKQRVTPVNVYVDGSVDVPIIGVIHSHHDMGNSFSHTDHNYINQNHDISLCISNTGISGQMRVKTECGRYALTNVVVVDHIEGFNVGEFVKEIDDNIAEQKFAYTKGVVGGNTFDYDDISDITVGKAVVPTDDLLTEVKSYQELVRTTDVVDAFYRVEFEMLHSLISSIGTAGYDTVEAVAFNDVNNVYTEDYYRIIDEISSACGKFSDNEKKALNGLASILKKKMDDYDFSIN